MIHEKPISRVVLFGGSSVYNSYLPEEFRHHIVLAAMLERGYPHQQITVDNWADNGEFIARYLLKGTYERHREAQPGIDVAIIRFGTNDQKRMDVQEYHVQMEKFLELLQCDFPGIQIILETGIYVDFPNHYNFDRNLILNPFWEVSRKIANTSGYPLVDYYEAARKQTEQGHWDIRVRKGLIIDSSLDSGKENDANWFTDIHPNPLGVRLAAQEEYSVLKEAFPYGLPTGQTAVKRQAKSNSDYAGLLNFSPDRLVVQKPATPQDGLQEAK